MRAHWKHIHSGDAYHQSAHIVKTYGIPGVTNWFIHTYNHEMYSSLTSHIALHVRMYVHKQAALLTHSSRPVKEQKCNGFCFWHFRRPHFFFLPLLLALAAFSGLGMPSYLQEIMCISTCIYLAKWLHARMQSKSSDLEASIPEKYMHMCTHTHIHTWIAHVDTCACTWLATQSRIEVVYFKQNCSTVEVCAYVHTHTHTHTHTCNTNIYYLGLSCTRKYMCMCTRKYMYMYMTSTWEQNQGCVHEAKLQHSRNYVHMCTHTHMHTHTQTCACIWPVPESRIKAVNSQQNCSTVKGVRICAHTQKHKHA
jgi:hypothetical protein